MLTIAWRSLVHGTAGALFLAGVSVPVLADEASDQPLLSLPQSETSPQSGAQSESQIEPQGGSGESAGETAAVGPILGDVLTGDTETTSGAVPGVQVAQGITTYEHPRPLRAQPRRGETVADRPRPQYDALGQRIGSFVLFPELRVIEQYESNIYYTPNNEDDDFITRLQPVLTLQSDWNNHQLQFQTGGDIGFYADHSDENFQDYYAGVSGRIDIRRSTQLRLETRYSHDHESRESPDDADAGSGGQVADEPTQLNIYSVGTALRHDFGRINGTVGGSFDRISFDDPDAIGGGTINEHERDRNIYETFVRVGYEIQPQYEAFVRGAYNKRDYDGLDNGVDRDSDGYTVAVGMAVDFGGLVFGDFYAGYRYQSYDDSSLESISGFGGGADITWNVTKLTTITGSLLGDLRETTQTNASGRLVSTGRIAVDHELRRNILLGANVSTTRDDYEGINRTDWIYGAGGDVTYLINRYLRGSLGYQFRKRDAEFAQDDFTNHVILLRVGLQY